MRDALAHAVNAAQSTGADLTEVRYEDITIRTLTKENDRIRNAESIRRKGLCISIYVDDGTGFAYTSSLSRSSIRETCRRAFRLAKSAGAAAKMPARVDPFPSHRMKGLRPGVKLHPKDASPAERMELVNRTYASAKENGARVSSIVVRYAELYGEKCIANTEGTDVTWHPLVTDLRCMVVSKCEDGSLVDGSEGRGGTFGLERFSKEDATPETLGANAAIWAKEKLGARAAPAGVFRSLCENRLVGVLAHESFGHLTEGDFIATRSSPLTDRMGKRLGSDHASIVDEGTPDISRYDGVWLPVDDQGVPTGRTTLLDRGVLSGYLHSRVTATSCGGTPTGNARAINFYFPPIPRMRNTYFLPGDMTDDEAIRELRTGIYAVQTSGGQVNMDGTFLFKASRGYWVEKGEISHPLKDVVLTDNILQFVRNVEGATEGMSIHSGYFGGCGKGMQYPLPVGLGGPKLLISQVRFGGERR